MQRCLEGTTGGGLEQVYTLSFLTDSANAALHAASLELMVAYWTSREKIAYAPSASGNSREDIGCYSLYITNAADALRSAYASQCCNKTLAPFSGQLSCDAASLLQPALIYRYRMPSRDVIRAESLELPKLVLSWIARAHIDYEWAHRLCSAALD